MTPYARGKKNLHYEAQINLAIIRTPSVLKLVTKIAPVVDCRYLPGEHDTNSVRDIITIFMQNNEIPVAVFLFGNRVSEKHSKLYNTCVTCTRVSNNIAHEYVRINTNKSLYASYPENALLTKTPASRIHMHTHTHTNKYKI